jgi:hypothetical protein
MWQLNTVLDEMIASCLHVGTPPRPGKGSTRGPAATNEFNAAI